MTMMDDKDDTLWGIFPRTVKSIFTYINNASNTRKDFEDSRKYSVRAKYIAIYNETIHELLDSSKLKRLRIRESKQDGLYMEGVKEVFVKSYGETIDWYHQGQK